MSSILKGITDSVQEGVIYQLDREDPLNKSEILIIGGAGRYTFDRLREKARKEAEQLAKDLQSDHPYAFVKSAYNAKQLTNTLNTIKLAYTEMEEIRRKGGVRSKNIKGVSETSSTGMGGGSAGIGGGAGLGIDKSPIEKVLEKPFGESVEEGLDRPKVLFNPKPMRKGPGDSPDDYEYTDYVPRGKEDKEAWAIKRTVSKQKLPAKKQKELDTGFYKSYLSNRPIREEDIEEDTSYAGGGGQGGNAGEARRTYVPQPAGAKESAIMKGIQNEYELQGTKKIEFSKENPPSLDYLYRHFLHDLLSSTNTTEPKDWIDNMNKHYGLSYTFRDYQNMGHKDYTNNWDKIVQKYILNKK